MCVLKVDLLPATLSDYVRGVRRGYLRGVQARNFIIQSESLTVDPAAQTARGCELSWNLVVAKFNFDLGGCVSTVCHFEHNSSLP